MSKGQRPGGKKSKSRDKRPARDRYWLSSRLEIRKVNNLMKHCGLSKQQAYERWKKDRQGRRMRTGLRKVA